MRRVAIVAYWYPPFNAVGGQRAAALARYLPHFGWEPVVVTVKPAGGPYVDPPAEEPDLTAGEVIRLSDRSLHPRLFRFLMREGPGGRVDRWAAAGARESGPLRAAHWLYRQWLSFPDEVWPWLIDSRRVRALLHERRVNAIISTSPPATAHLLAARAARALGVPWLADYRDLWSQRSAWARVWPLRAMERRIERRALRTASALVTVSAPIADALARLHGRPAVVVPNGFDPAERAAAVPTPLPIDARRFTLLHTGTLTPARDPALLFEAIDGLRRAGELDVSNLEIWFVGRYLDAVRRALDRWPAVAPAVRLSGPVPRAVALDAQRRATVLVVLGSPEPKHAGDMSTKVFEYLDARRPVLAVATRGGALEALLTETGGGAVVTSAGEAAVVLARWLREHASHGRVAWCGAPARVARYERRALTGEFARVLDGLAAG